MKKRAYFLVASMFVLMTLGSCNSNDILSEMPKNPDMDKAQTCKLILNVSKETYSDEPQTRSIADWENGDKIFLTFSTATGSAYGDAVYNNESWTVSYYGTLTEGEIAKCKAVYFDCPESESSSVVQLTDSTGIYEDLNGLYSFSDGILSVTANLSPKTGRIRFAGNDKDTIMVYGISHYDTYDASTGKYTSTSLALKTSVQSEYTPYIYGEFTDSINPRLNIITATSGYTKLLSNNIYKKGESGFINIPSASSHNGWTNSVILKVNGVEFTMIPVNYSKGFFLLAETETTEELYSAVFNGIATTESQMPKNISYSYSKEFIYKLNTDCGLNFYVPRQDQWLFAFKGGNMSKNYKYSGSNTVEEVAWYEGNSENRKHDVKQLKPNELGFYDMSGNFSEHVIDGNYIRLLGGDCYNSASYCTYENRNSGSSDGLRLALKPW